MKKISLLLAACGLVAGAAWGQTTNEIVLGSHVVRQGGTLLLPIVLLNPDATNTPAGGQIIVEYDPTVIQLATDKTGALVTDTGPIISGSLKLSSGNPDFTDSTGAIKPAKAGDKLANIAVIGTDNVTGPGVFVTLHATAASGATDGQSTMLTIPSNGGLVLNSASSTPVPATTPVNGSVTVGTTTTGCSVQLGATVSGSPSSTGDGLIWVVTDDGMLHSIDVNKCAEATGFPVMLGKGTAGSSGRPVPMNGLIYVLTNDGKLYAADKTGKVTQVADAGAAVTQSTPAIVGNPAIAIIGDAAGSIHAINTATGKDVSAPQKIGTALTSSPAAIPGNQIIIGSNDNNIYVLNPDLTVRQKLPTGGPVTSSPFITDSGTALVGSGDGKVYRFIISTGAQAGNSFDTGAPILANPFLDGEGDLYVVNNKGQLFILMGAANATPMAGSAIQLGSANNANESPLVFVPTGGVETLYFGDSNGVAHVIKNVDQMNRTVTDTTLSSSALSSPAVTGTNGASDLVVYTTSTGSVVGLPLQ